MLTLQHLTRQLRGHQADVTLLPGCLLRLIGDAQAKTIILRVIAGKIHCPKGHIFFAEQETRGDTEFFSDVIYLSPYHRPHWLTKKRTVQIQLEKWARDGTPELLNTAIHFFELAELLEVSLGKLTATQWQRVRLARLIIQPCTIWLLEEPLSMLDAEGKQMIEVLIAGRCKQNGIVLYTHEGESHLNPHHVLEL